MKNIAKSFYNLLKITASPPSKRPSSNPRRAATVRYFIIFWRVATNNYFIIFWRVATNNYFIIF